MANAQFGSVFQYRPVYRVFTHEDSEPLDKGPSPHYEMPDIKVFREGVLKLLSGIKPLQVQTRSQQAKLIQSTAEHTSSVLAHIFQQSLHGHGPTPQ